MWNRSKYIAVTAWRNASMMARTFYIIAVVLPGALTVLAGRTGWLWLDGLLPWWGWLLIALLVTLIWLVYSIGGHAHDLQTANEPRIKIEGMYPDDNYRRTEIEASNRLYICRIAIRNLSTTKEVKGVTVRIIKFGDGNDFDVPQTLLPAKKTINAGVFLVWNFAQGSHVRPPEQAPLFLNVDYHDRRLAIYDSKVEITIEASAANVPPVTRDFVLVRDEAQRPMLVPKDELNGVVD